MGATIPLENNFYYAISMIYVIAIIFVYSLNVFWNVKFLRLVKINSFTWMLYYSIIISVLFVISFSFILFWYIRDTPIDASIFAVMVIRPLIFLSGCGFVGTTRGRFVSLERGGSVWEPKQANS